MIRYIATIVLIFSWCFGKSQDALFSQYYTQPTNLNVAAVGGIPGLLLNGLMRTQWTRIPGSFTSSHIGGSMQLFRFNGSAQGLGVNITQSEDGEGHLNTGKYSLSYAYHGKFQKIPIHFHFGLGYSIIQRYVDWSKLVFSDQLDAVLGNIYPSAIDQPVDLNYASSTANFGFIIGGIIGVKNAKDLDWNIGYSTNNLFAYRKSFYKYDTFGSIRHTIHAELLMPITSLKGANNHGGLAYNLHTMYNYQGSLKVLDITNILRHNYFNAGLGYRSIRFPFDLKNNNQIIYIFGYNKIVSKKYFVQINYSFDQSIDKLASRVGSTHEISLNIYISNLTRKKRKGDNECTEFIKAGKLSAIGFPEGNAYKRVRKKK